MQIILDKNTHLTHDALGNIHITRPSITGRVASHMIKNPQYDLFDIARWLYRRILRMDNSLVQVEFPNMSESDREFLMTGITPQEWNDIFKEERV